MSVSFSSFRYQDLTTQVRNGTMSACAEEAGASFRHSPDGTESFEDLAQILAHRIRSLVASVDGFADLLADSVAEPDQRELVFRIMESTAKIEQVLADLLFYGRQIEPVLLPLPVAEVIDGLRSSLESHEMKKIVWPSNLPPQTRVYADPVLVRQALLILVQNALDAVRTLPDGQVVVRFEEDVSAKGVFTVWNPGCFELENLREDVFRPFFTTKAQNLGLGLPIARRIAEAHGGSVVLVESEEIKGISFALRLSVVSY